ncbi:hypothetical protein RvY_12141 [Ramazzottius varieornatus]|uniref:Uncharacterized protein n=1 Tax=Ramazzottius varieornatus TaxID=947166 RepID=A0A1D1VNX0_RAMVA|nr:hypothetical protein RvY_12141 [Ramazzottius varieornatus]
MRKGGGRGCVGPEACKPLLFHYRAEPCERGVSGDNNHWPAGAKLAWTKAVERELRELPNGPLMSVIGLKASLSFFWTAPIA